MGINAGNTKILGTEGNEITPIDGQQINKEKDLADQYSNDFGDMISLDDMDAEIISDVLDNPRPEIQQAENRPSEVIPPGGKPNVDENGIVQQQTQTTDQAGSQQIDLSNYVTKEDYEELQGKHNELQGKFNDLKGKVNGGLEGMSQEELNVLKHVKHDIENSPLSIIVNDYYQGKLDVNGLMQKKTVADFMADGQEYNSDDAVSDTNSSSWKAREEWEREKEDFVSKYRKIGNEVTESLKARKPEQTDEQIEEQNQKFVDDLIDKIPASKSHIDVFSKWIDAQKNLYLPLYVAFNAIAKRTGKSNVIEPNPQATVKGDSPSGITDVDQNLYDEFGD